MGWVAAATAGPNCNNRNDWLLRLPKVIKVSPFFEYLIYPSNN